MNSDSEWTTRETEEFIRLLKKIQKNDYWIPSLEAWQEVQRTFSRWAVELVIVDRSDAKAPKILLTRYGGEGVPSHRGFFHIPGGFEKFPESLQETCSRIAKDELDIDVEYQGVLGVHKWTLEESPIGSRLLSVYAACTERGEIPLTEGRRFFTRGELLALDPKEMTPSHPHRSFASKYLTT